MPDVVKCLLEVNKTETEFWCWRWTSILLLVNHAAASCESCLLYARTSQGAFIVTHFFESAALLNNRIGEFFITMLGIIKDAYYCQCCSTFSWDRLWEMHTHCMNSSQQYQLGERRLLCYLPNLRFAEEIDLIAWSLEALQILTNRLTSAARQYGMEVSSEKSKVHVDSWTAMTANIRMNGEKLKRVSSFK